MSYPSGSSAASSFALVRWLLAVLLGSVWAPLARAQPLGEVVVVPFGAPELAAPLSATAMFEAALIDARVPRIPLHDARDRFSARSRPPQTASDSDLDQLADAAQEAIEHVAFGRTAAAQKSVREVISRAERTLESLNRETATARHILDACLSLVRSALQSGKRELALEQATRCRRLVPDLVPSEDAHPANVVGVLAEADNLLRRMRIGQLSVKSAPESGCSVYLNGRHLGTTPFQLDRAAAGDYRVQVECGRSLGRVHVMQLGDQPVSLLVDTQFDRAVASDPRLLLQYKSAREAREQAVSHAVQLGREIGATDVILVGVRDDRAELLRVRVDQQRLVARATVPWTERHGFSRPGLEEAITILAEARLEGEPSLAQGAAQVAAPEPAAEPAAEPPSLAAAELPAAVAEPPPTPIVPPSESAIDARAEDQRRRRRFAGYGLLGVAGGLVALGIGYDVRAQRLNDELSRLELGPAPPPSAPEDPVRMEAARRIDDLQPKFERARSLRWIGLAGPALATAAVALVVEGRRAPTWWSYAFAGAGLGLIAGGSVGIALSDRCTLRGSDGACRRERDSEAWGALLVASAVPLLSIPLLQRLKPSAGRDYTFVGAPRAGGLELSLRGAF